MEKERVMTRELKGKWGVVTGASSGIGIVLAEELAASGANLVLVARRLEALDEVAARIRAAHGVDVRVETADLARPGEPDRLFESIQKSGIEVSILANNAGFAAYGAFDAIDAGTEESMIDLDIKALVRLTRLFAPRMRAAGFGRILLTASVGAYSPGPLYAVYCAAKSFVLSYGLAVRHELRGSGVSVTILSPGVVKTEFHKVAGHEKNRFKERTGMEPGPVGRAAVRGMLRGKAEVVPGLLTKLLVFGTRLIPRSAQAAMSGGLMS
jgi:short-subunit dehydrogenase